MPHLPDDIDHHDGGFDINDDDNAGWIDHDDHHDPGEHIDDGGLDIHDLDIHVRPRKHDCYDWSDNHVTFRLDNIDPANVHVYIDGIEHIVIPRDPYDERADHAAAQQVADVARDRRR